MIELDRHIEILLLSNDCVIIPGFGGFMAHHVTARYDEDDNLFLPPLRTLGFNPQLKLNDSLLAQSYVEAYDISYPEALRKIEDEVCELKQHLNNEGFYELNDIGTLKLNEDGICIFEPCEAGILTPDLYGLSSFEASELYSTLQETSEIIETDVNAIDSELPAIQDNNYDEQDDEVADDSIRIKISWIRNVCAAAVAIIAFFFTTTPIRNSNDVERIQTANILSLAISRPSATPDTIIEKTNIAEKSDKDSKNIQTTALEQQSDTVSRAERKGFCIVLASHVTKRNAENFVEELHKKGYDKAYTYTNRNIRRVVYGNYETESEALSALRSIRGNKYFEQSWIYEKK